MSRDAVFKKFDKELFNENDPAKYLAIEYFKKSGKNAIVNPKRYGIDLIVDDEFYCEVEVKRRWSGENFIYGDLQIPFRKSKFITADKPVIFMVMNLERTHAFLVKGEDVMNSKVDEVSNKYARQGEYFYKVSLDKLTKVKL